MTGASQDYLISFESVLEHAVKPGDNGIEINGQCPEHVDPDYINRRIENFIQGNKGMFFSGTVSVLKTNGIVDISQDGIKIKQASEVIIEVRFLDNVEFEGLSYEEVRSEHIQDYQELFNRVDLFFGEQLPLPIDERKQRFRAGEDDPGLIALFFQYGRYLLIASSREGSLPPNLQGIWAWQYPAIWSSNWTTNINIQMNYWPAEITNLKECLYPYFDWIDQLVEAGKKTAEVHYGTRGSVVHHNVDRWINTNPVGIKYGEQTGQSGSASYAMWPMALHWIAQELFKYFEYQRDELFLKERVYPVLRQIVLFTVDWLQYVDGEYISYPSTSPENRFSIDGKEYFAITKNSALDIQLIQEITKSFNETCRILKIDDELLVELNEKVDQLTPVKIGRQGQILEWDEEYIEMEVDHRHFSHLYGMFPGELFDRVDELIEATKVSLEIRTSTEGETPRTGWSNAWLINYYAVLQDKEKVSFYLKQMMNETVLDNLWGFHPPLSIGGSETYQIDCNFGGTAGIANMLVNERYGKLNVLPALPEFIPDGFVKGLRLKNNRQLILSGRGID